MKIQKVPNPFPPRQARTSTAAVLSLVFGIVSLTTCLLPFAIPAVICGHTARGKIRRSRGLVTGDGVAIGGLACGYVGLVLLAGVGVFFAMVFKIEEVADRASGELFRTQAAVAPSFPELGEFETLNPSGVRVCQVKMKGGSSAVPGSQMQMRVYLPPGNAAAGTLSCVLVAPAGTNLMQGNSLEELDEDAYHDEALPYAEAGLACVLYSIDGHLNEDVELRTEDGDANLEGIGSATAAYEAFRDAGAGTINGRFAMEFVLARLPEVDPDQIYAAGHSSAGTLALLMAAHEPRLAGVLAYAPCVDVEAFLGDLADEPGIGLVYPSLDRFCKRSSPVTHAERLAVPVFLFGSKEDSMVVVSDLEAFVDKAAMSAARVTFRTVDEGDHYGAMIEKGIPMGIEWIRIQQGRTEMGNPGNE